MVQAKFNLKLLRIRMWQDSVKSFATNKAYLIILLPFQHLTGQTLNDLIMQLHTLKRFSYTHKPIFYQGQVQITRTIPDVVNGIRDKMGRSKNVCLSNRRESPLITNIFQMPIIQNINCGYLSSIFFFYNHFDYFFFIFIFL